MKKNISYMLSLLVSAVLIIIPLSLAIIAVLTQEYKVWGIAAIIAIGIAVILSKPVSNWRTSIRQEVQNDEFGNSKKIKFEKLSQKQRDEINLQKIADMERIIGSQALKRLTHPGSENPEEDLEKLIGLKELKQQVREMAAKMEFDRQENKGKKKSQIKSEASHHAVYFGSPGTGKTTMARIMTGFLYKYGYIKENKCVEVDGNFLKAGADTTTKTTYVIQKSFGGVLFIDEAYALAQGDMYGYEAIATLIKQMEDNRDRFILILAGYTNEMKELLETNPGFKSRIKDYLLFADYNDDEMLQIFKSMAHAKGYVVNSSAETQFEKRLANEKPLNSFGNARTARSILDEALEKHAYNFITEKWSEDLRHTITGSDINEFPRVL